VHFDKATGALQLFLIRVYPYYYLSKFSHAAQTFFAVQMSSPFNLFNLFNPFNFGCGSAALGSSVVSYFPVASLHLCVKSR
jgi:hypothetical protein